MSCLKHGTKRGAGMAKVAPIDAVGGLICWLNDKYIKHDIKGVVVALVNAAGEIEVTYTDALSHIERVGLLEVAKAMMDELPNGS